MFLLLLLLHFLHLFMFKTNIKRKLIKVDCRVCWWNIIILKQNTMKFFEQFMLSQVCLSVIFSKPNPRTPSCVTPIFHLVPFRKQVLRLSPKSRILKPEVNLPDLTSIYGSILNLVLWMSNPRLKGSIGIATSCL